MGKRLTVAADRLDSLRTLDVAGLGRLAFAAFLLALLGYGGALAYYTLASFDVVNLHRDALVDDAFYYFEIAGNLAAGEFSTFDGGITRTNGYHPFWLVLVTPVYWLFDRESALFAIKALEIMLIASGVCLLATAVRSARLPWILVFAVPPALYSQQGMLVGMEAAAGSFMLGAFFVGAVLFAGGARRGRGVFAALAFLLPWVRLEYAAIALFATCALYLVRSASASAGSAKARPGYFSMARLRTDGLPVLAAIGGLLAYFLYNGIVFGGIVPVSGARKLAWSRVWFDNEHGSHLAPLSAAQEHFLATATADLFAVFELCVYVIVALLIGRACHWQKDCRTFLALLVFVLALGVETVLAKAQAATLYHPDVRKSTAWYYVPGYLMAALMLPVRCCVAVFVLRLLARGRLVRAAAVTVPVVCLVGIYAAFDSYAIYEPFRFVAAKSENHRLDDVWAPARGGIQLDAMLPKDAVVGSWDSGEVGYFTQLPVVNLDGLVNSYEYLRRGGDVWDLWLQHGGVPEFGITHFVNNVRDGQTFGDMDPQFAYVGSRIKLGQDVWSMKLWSVGVDRGRTGSWTEVAAPSHGSDGRRSGYFEHRSGRLVQLFVPDCIVGGASNVPEMVTFSWAEGARPRATTRLWVQPLRTELGYCTATFLLPHGAESAARIAVDATTFDSFVGGTMPLLRSSYAVYVIGNQLALSKPGCRAEASGYFFLHVWPTVRRHLSPGRRPYGFENYDGAVNWLQRETAGRCLAVVELPAYPIGEVLTGELQGDERVWQGRIDGLALRPAAVDEFIAAAERIVHAAYDVYVDESENKLLYVAPLAGREECAPTYVWLHVHPRRLNDLPQWQREYGFANRDFDLGQVGFASGDRCLAVVRLPDFDLGQLRIGELGAPGATWRPR